MSLVGQLLGQTLLQPVAQQAAELAIGNGRPCGDLLGQLTGDPVDLGRWLDPGR
jgi:hypothetical protein